MTARIVSLVYKAAADPGFGARFAADPVKAAEESGPLAPDERAALDALDKENLRTAVGELGRLGDGEGPVIVMGHESYVT